MSVFLGTDQQEELDVVWVHSWVQLGRVGLLLQLRFFVQTGDEKSYILSPYCQNLVENPA